MGPPTPVNRQTRLKTLTTTATNPSLEVFKNNTTKTILTHLIYLPSFCFNLGEISCVYFSNIYEFSDQYIKDFLSSYFLMTVF